MSPGTSSIAMPARWRGGSREMAPYSAMVGIARGGLVPAAIVARELDLRGLKSIRS